MNPNRTVAGRLRLVGLVGAGVLAGGALAGAGVASAATSTTSGGATASTSSAPSASGAVTSSTGSRSLDHGGSTPVRSDEKAVSASQAATLTAAALKAVPGATVYRVETDAGDAAYEVHLTKADGSPATVEFDSSLAVTKVEDGMGLGDPAPPGGTAPRSGAVSAPAAGGA